MTLATAHSNGRERILAAFDGRSGWPRPVAPAYPNGLLGQTLRRRYQERYLEQMGGRDQVVLNPIAFVEEAQSEVLKPFDEAEPLELAADESGTEAADPTNQETENVD